MTPGMTMLVLAAIGTALSLVNVVFLAGALKGVVSTRLDHIEARLTQIEGALHRGGFTVRKTEEEA